jgi:hypothetical protein
MSFLYSIVSIQVGWLIAAGIVAVCLLVLWISALLSRRLFVTVKKSEETELVAFHLRRIADALERLAVARESQTQPSMDPSAGRTASIPTFGH